MAIIDSEEEAFKRKQVGKVIVRNSNDNNASHDDIVSWTFIEVPLCARHHAKLFCSFNPHKNAMKMYCYSYYIDQKTEA